MARVRPRAERHDRCKEAAMCARPIDAEGSEPPERAPRVEGGQVMGPRPRPGHIERCWVCREYRGMADAHVEWLVCGLTDEAVRSGVWARDPGGAGRDG